VAQVDFQAGVVRLEPRTTKNDEGRTFPFDALPALKRLLKAQRDQTKALERATGRIVPHVFHRDGVPIKYMRRAWLSACKRAATVTHANGVKEVVRPELLGRLPHDFRRRRCATSSGGRAERVACSSPSLTRSVFDRWHRQRAGPAGQRVEARRAARLGPGAAGGQSGTMSQQ
jgi:hypothetical protein